MDGIIHKLKLRDLSLLKAVFVIMIIAIIIDTFIIVVEFKYFQQLMKDYINNNSALQIILICQVCVVILTVCLTIFLAGWSFYYLKLKEPIHILRKASQNIIENDLNFKVEYSSKDEMGELCKSFEVMREEMEKNIKTLWKSVEDRNQMNAIFAHELRTPLSIMKGYTELMTIYISEEKMNQEKLQNTISSIENHLLRLENFTELMHTTQKLEDIAINSKKINSINLITMLENVLNGIIKSDSILFEITSHIEVDTLYMDTNIIVQVLENIISNALRYAKFKVCINFTISSNGILSIKVVDDGPGFTLQSKQNCLLPFYSEESKSSNHQGLGLYIAKVFCEKHDGRLFIQNNSCGGADITATFMSKYS